MTDKQTSRENDSRLSIDAPEGYPGYPAGAEFSEADMRVREFMAHVLNRVRGKFEVCRAVFIEAGKLLYLEDFSAVGRQLDAVQGKLLHGAYAGGRVEADVARLAAADAGFLELAGQLAAAMEALRDSPAPVRELAAALALAARLQAAVETRFAAAG